MDTPDDFTCYGAMAAFLRATDAAPYIVAAIVIAWFVYANWDLLRWVMS